MSRRKLPRFVWMPNELRHLRRLAKRIHAGKLSYYRAMNDAHDMLLEVFSSEKFIPSKQAIRNRLYRLVCKLKRKAGGA